MRKISKEGRCMNLYKVVRKGLSFGQRPKEVRKQVLLIAEERTLQTETLGLGTCLASSPSNKETHLMGEHSELERGAGQITQPWWGFRVLQMSEMRSYLEDFHNKSDMIWLHFLIELLWLLCGNCTTEDQGVSQGDQLGSSLWDPGEDDGGLD